MKQHEHILEEHDPERRDFQIERLILFTDAVFAIAITLLVIELKPQELANLTHDKLVDFYQHMILKFAGFIISFFVIAIYWRSHHRVFGFVTRYTEKLIWLNFLFLFTVVLMPFSSAFYSENFGEEAPFVFYNMNVVIMALANYKLISYVFNPANQLVRHQPSSNFIHLFKSRAVAIPILFFCSGLLAFLHLMPPWPLLYILIWPMMAALNWYNKRKFKATAADLS